MSEQTERIAAMTRKEFERWAHEIGLSDAQMVLVWRVIGREYGRGIRAALNPKREMV